MKSILTLALIIFTSLNSFSQTPKSDKKTQKSDKKSSKSESKTATSLSVTPTCRETILNDIELTEFQEYSYIFPCSIPDGTDVNVNLSLTIKASRCPGRDWWLTVGLLNPAKIIIDEYKVTTSCTWPVSGVTTAKVINGTVTVVFRAERSVVDAIRMGFIIAKNSTILVVPQ